MVVGLSMLLYVPDGLAQIWVLLAFTVAGIGTAIMGPSMMIGYQNAIPHGRLGRGVGLMSLFRQFGASVGTTIVGAIVGASAAATVAADMQSAIHQAVLVQVGVGLLVVCMAWLMADPPLGTARGI